MCHCMLVANAKVLGKFARVICLAGVVAALVAPRLPAQDEAAHFDWMPPESVGVASRGRNLGGEQIIPEITITPTPKATADMSKYTKEYVIELEKFGISNKTFQTLY